MIELKTPEEIKKMKEGGQRLKEVVKRLIPQIKVGVTTESIDKEAGKLIVKEGGEPSFKTVPGYFWNTCLTVNEQIVHTPPSARILKEGDVVTLDIGMLYQGFHTDYAQTVIVGEKVEAKKKHFLEVGKIALAKAIKEARVGNRLGKVSQAIEKEIYSNGFFVIRDLTGHGVGRKLHEDPFVPGFLERSLEKTPLIKEGLVIAIEVIYSMGTEDIAHEGGNEWSIVTADGSLSACFEHTVAVTAKGAQILV